MNNETSPSQAFLDDMDKYGVKDWTNPRAFYDYHAAWKAGAKPDKSGHWPSNFKHPLSHERYVIENGKLLDTITGKEATEEEREVNNVMREDYLRNLAF